MGSFATVNTDMQSHIFVGLPEDLIVIILKRLPIKSQIRFTCVSKRWRFMILSDPNFAKSQFQMASEQRTLSRRALHESDCESLDFEKPMDSRKVRCPFKQPGLHVRILCSCNGLVFAASSNSDMYIWNPSTGFFKKLPDPGALPSAILWFYGFGYVSAIDDYKVIVSFDVSGKKIVKAMVFSSRAKSWKTIELPYYPIFYLGNLFNEALHWRIYLHGDIVAFDLAKEQFRTMSLPASLNYHHGGVHITSLGSVGGCLCVIIQKNANDSCIDLWVMREYEVADSWTKLYNLKFSDQREWVADLRPVLATETSTFLEKWSHSYRGCKCELIRIGRKEEKIETYMVRKEPFCVIAYEESLLWLNDCSELPSNCG